MAGYASRALMTPERPFPDFADVLQIAVANYENEGKNDDTLIEVL